MTTHNQNTLILRMRDVLREIAEHEHPIGVDAYCNDRHAYAGEHMVHVLRILDEAQAEIDERVKRESALADDAEKLIAEALAGTVEPDVEPIPEYVYFVSFNHGHGFGANTVTRSSPVTSMADVEDLTRDVVRIHRSAGYSVFAGQVVILNFILLSGPKGSTS